MAFDGHTPPTVSAPDPHGTVALTYNKVTVHVRFSWGALTNLQAAWGETWLEQAAEALEKKQLEQITDMLAFASNMSRADALALSPPVTATVEALTAAWQVAWIGHAFEQWDAEEVEPETEPEKPKAPATWWGRLGKWLLELESNGANSSS